MEKKITGIADSLINEKYGRPYNAIMPLKVSGSGRKYYRLYIGRETAVLCYSDNVQENETFIRLTRYLTGKGINVPEIKAVNSEKTAYLSQDLGRDDLLSHIRKDKKATLRQEIKGVINQLVRFQRLPEGEWKNTVEFAPLGRELIDYDLEYARVNFFDYFNVNYDREALQEEYRMLKARLLSYPPHLWGLMFRDFQSRNIMMDRKPYFIDYQSSRKGPGIYDLVSFSWQAKAGFTPEERKMICDYYIRSMEEEGIKCREEIETNLHYWALFRILQTLGAYGLRGLKEGKPHFIESIPAALENISELLTGEMNDEFPVMTSIIRKIKEDFSNGSRV